MQKKDYKEDDRRLIESWLYSMGTAIALLVLIGVTCLICGCTTTKYVPTESVHTECVRTDSALFERILDMMRENVRRNQTTSDTTIINVTNTYTLDANGDTISKDTNTKEYRSTNREVELEHQLTQLRDSTRLLRAQLDSQKADTIQVPYPVERELSFWEKTKMNFGGMAIGGLGACVIGGLAALTAWMVKRKRRK